jgi:hypothetical protein
MPTLNLRTGMLGERDWFDPKKQLLDADAVIGGKYVINGEY